MAGVVDELRWTAEEERDAGRLSWLEFDAKYAGKRTYHAWRMRRLDVKRGRTGKARRVAAALPAPVVTIAPGHEAVDDEALWRAMVEMQRVQLAERAKLTRHELTVTLETDRPWGLVFMSDLHLGNIGTDHEAVRADVKLIRSCDRLGVYLGGDGVDNYVISALAHVARDEQVAPPWLQWRALALIIRELLPSLVAVGSGNHDAWTRRVAGIDGTLAALGEIPVLYTGEETYLTLRFTSGQEYAVYRKHRPWSSSRLNPLYGVKQSFRYGQRAWDVGVLEHHHEPGYETFHAHGLDRLAVKTGSYKVMDGHAREFGFQPRMGTPVVVFHPWRRSIVPFARIEDAIEFLER